MRNGRRDNVALIADDDMFIRKVLTKTLSGLCSFVEVIDGGQVMQSYIESFPDIIFLDIHLPVVSGLDLVKKIKEVDKDAYIVMLTSDSTKENVQRALKDGASGFMSKPFDTKTALANFHRCPTVKFS